MSLGEKLRNLRLKTRRTLDEQSKLLKVSMNSVYRWEHDLAMPRRSALKLMADYFGVPMDWLLADNSAASLINESEQTLLSMFRKLPGNTRYKVLGYVERICVEESSIEYQHNIPANNEYKDIM
ncbi:MAG: helix-turn-helix domain-containing protein [Oscillospiraceae bacterium]|nr:helix-turn-helix domain-containing protein [Oscillospiraceae bacterium]